MPSLADGQTKNFFLEEKGELPRIEQPFEEVCGAKMSNRQAPPVEDLLGDPSVSTHVSGLGAAGGSLRQIYDRRDACLFCSLREIDGGGDQSGLDG
jgi:hypothetical protein